MDELYVSEEGLAKLEAELDECRERSRVVADAIETARGFGDLKENSEYHAAKDEQAMLQARIRDLEDKVARAVILNHSEMDTDKAYVGATVRVLNKKTNKEMCYTLVSPVEADINNGKLSTQSPVGQALLGKGVGETVVANVPAGALEMEILEITR